MRFPHAQVEVSADGAVAPAALQDAVSIVRAAGADDILVFVHGWGNDPRRAQARFEELADALWQVRGEAGRDRRLACVGVLWPALIWSRVGQDGPGRPALAQGDHGDEARLRLEIEDVVDDRAARAQLLAVVAELTDSPEARADFVAGLRAWLPPMPTDDDDPPPILLRGPAETAFTRAGSNVGVGLADDDAPGGGGPAGLGVDAMVRGARRLLNLTTYYVMKQRSGVVGELGVAHILSAMAEALPTARLHLAGHSFGARASAAAARACPVPVHALVLLQGAFSHYGLAQDWDGEGRDGYFHEVPGRLAGPLLVTHTHRDRAVGWTYALASRLARDVGAGLGGSNDRYGGIGCNGALKVPGAVPGRLLEVGRPYVFAPGQVFNLRADAFIQGHGQVTGLQVAHALSEGMSSC